MSIERITTPRTLLAKERGEMADFLRGSRPGMGEDRITELLEFTELKGDAVELRDGVALFLTDAGWGGDVFAPRTEAEAA
jgi:hypothetical protein